MLLVALSLVIGVVSFFLLAHRGTRLAALWGALYGTATGFWLLAPVVLNGHHLRPATSGQWLIVTIVLAGTFLALGTLLAIVGTMPIAIATSVIRRDFRNPAFAYARWTVIWVPIAYLLTSAIAEWTNFGQPLSLDMYLAAVRPLAVWCTFIFVLLAALRHSHARNGRPVHTRAIAAAFLMLTSAGILLLPLRLNVPPPPPVGTAPNLVRSQGTPRTAPLLVIGLDGGNWRTLHASMERGAAPTFSRLVASGRHGEVEALWPPYWSAPAWGAIVTGHSQDEIGVYEDLSASVSGFSSFELPLTATPALDTFFAVELIFLRTGVLESMPAPRNQLKWSPVWERLTRAGVKTAVIHFPFTYPAAGQATYVISNRAKVDLWDALGVRQGERGQLVEPAADFDKWFPILSDDHLGSSLFEQLLGRATWPKPTDSMIDPIAVLKKAANTQQQLHIATMQLLGRDPSLQAVMLHVASLDEVCHAFWQYRFPDDFPTHSVPQADVEQLGPVIDRVIEHLDRQLAVLIETFPTPPNVLIVSDHGEHSSLAQAPWKGRHASPGVFIAAGPNISPRTDTLAVSYYDIVPTILDLTGFEKPPDLRGRSLATP